MSKKGFTLIVSVILVVVVSIAVLGVTTFIVQRFSQQQTNQIKKKCIYLAQAGIHSALYWFRFHNLTGNGYFTLGQTAIDESNFFVLGGTDADVLMVNTNSTVLMPITGRLNQRFRQLQGLSVQNATNSKTITVSRMIVSWNNSNRLRIIFINNLPYWIGNLWSPANCNISDLTLNTIPTINYINSLQFSNNMSGATINIEFVMTDGSSKTVTVYPASSNYNFTVNSSGKTTGSNIYRTIQAEYNALTGKIITYKEIDAEQIPP